jgi:uncharacterized protein YodC (DUF2158 family)
MSRLIEKLFGTMPPPPNPLGLQRGDIVRLKSGGPKMTVSDVTSRGFINCEWFEGEKLNCARFSPSSINIAES